MLAQDYCFSEVCHRMRSPESVRIRNDTIASE